MDACTTAHAAILMKGVVQRQMAARILRLRTRPVLLICREASSTRLPAQEILTDKYGRNHTYLRISLTERCNLRCTCKPDTNITSFMCYVL